MFQQANSPPTYPSTLTRNLIFKTPSMYLNAMQCPRHVYFQGNHRIRRWFNLILQWWKLFNALTGERERELELLPPLQCRRGAPCGRECLDPGAAAKHGADEVTVPGKDDDIPAIVLLTFSLCLSSSSSSNSSWSFSSSFSFSPSLSNFHKAVPRRRHGYWCGRPNCPQLGRFSKIHSDGVATLLCSVSCTVHALLIAFGLPTTIHGRITNSSFLFFFVVFFFSILRLKESLIRLFGQIFECKTMPNSSSKMALYSPF